MKQAIKEEEKVTKFKTDGSLGSPVKENRELSILIEKTLIDLKNKMGDLSKVPVKAMIDFYHEDFDENDWEELTNLKIRNGKGFIYYSETGNNGRPSKMYCLSYTPDTSIFGGGISLYFPRKMLKSNYSREKLSLYLTTHIFSDVASKKELDDFYYETSFAQSHGFVEWS